MRYFISRTGMYDTEDVDTIYRDFLFVMNGERVSAKKVRSSFVDVFNEVTSLRLEFGQYRHAAKAFYEALVITPEREIEIHHAQFGHSAETGSTVYARSQFSLREFSRSRMAEFRECSIKWHQLLLGESFYIDHKRKRVSCEGSGVEVGGATMVNNYHTSIFTPPLLTVLQKNKTLSLSVNNDDLTVMKKIRANLIARFGFVEFKSVEQAQAVRRISTRKDQYLVILGTGGGKSLCYLLPASIELGLSAVIVPLKSLLSDAMYKCSQLNFKCRQWNGDDDVASHIDLDIIFFTIEQATSWSGVQFLASLKNVKVLNRIVIDEAHTIITWAGFREVMHRVPLLRSVNTQMVLLSATVPDTVLQNLKLLFGDFFVIKGTCVRPNIRYAVEQHDDIRLKLKELCTSFLSSRRTAGRMVVFSLSRKEALDTATMLSEQTPAVAIYTSDCSDEEREDVLQGLRNGTYLVLSATSAFSMGVDYNAVDLVVHRGGFHSLIDYCQESGRAGRDGTKSQSIVLCEASGVDHGAKLDENALEYLHTVTRCRRSLLHMVVENENVTCFDSGNYMQCDVCEKSNAVSVTLRREVPLIIDYKNLETATPSSSFSAPSTTAVASDPFSLTPNSSVLSELEIETDPCLPKLSQAHEVKNKMFSMQDQVRNTVEEIRKAAYNCIYCRIRFNLKVRHRNGDLFNCDKQRRARLCMCCLGSDHVRSDCQVKNNKHVCLKCCLPANASNYEIHSSYADYGLNCSVGLTHFLRPLCWLMFRDNKRRSQLAQNFKFTDTESGYHDWLQEVPENGIGLSNYCTVFNWCVTNKIL